MWRLLTVTALFCVLYRETEAACANGCSGHGTCGQNNICSCFDGWDAGAADCSFRTCPTGPAWADKAYATDKAHLPSTCSSAGICNHKTGQCKCFEGFTGSACQRSVCPNNCNGHGTCVSIADMSYYYGADYLQATDTAAAGDGVGIVYTNWDKDSITMCECDPSYFGADCSLHMCAKGDDPLTINQNYRKIKLTLSTSGTFSGDLGFTFQGVTSYIDLDSPSSANCKQAIESSQHIGVISCIYTATTSTSWEYSIEFHSFPVLSRSNNLFNHNGNPLITEFTCDASLAGGSPTCLFQDVQDKNIREWAYCSNRGTCDFSSGMCACNVGYGGSACSNSTSFHGTGVNSAPGMQILVDGSDYRGDALQVRSEKSASSDFYLIQAISNNQRMFYVRGDGAVGLTSLVTPGGATISAGGLNVAASGVTITSGGLTVTDGGAQISSTVAASPVQSNVLEVKANTNSALSTSFSVLDVKTLSAPTHTLLKLSDSAGTTQFAAKSNGKVEIHNTGLSVTGGVTIESAGITVSGGTNVYSGGLNVRKMGITVQEGAIVAQGGIHVKAGGMQIDSGSTKFMSGGMDIVSGGMRVHAGVAQFKAGVYITGGHTVMAGGMTITGGLTVKSNGMDVTGGITVANGLTVSDTGITLAGTTFTGSTPGSAGLELTTSDRRLKERLQKITKPLETLDKLKGVYYYWTKESRAKHNYDTRRHLGFLAQDVAEALPEAVDTIKEGAYLGIDYPSLVPLLTEGIKDLSKLSRDVQAELDLIKKRISSIETRHLEEKTQKVVDLESVVAALVERVAALELEAQTKATK